MLVLTIVPGEYVQVGNEVRIFGPVDKPVRIGIEAPPEVMIERSNCKDKTPRHLAKAQLTPEPE